MNTLDALIDFLDGIDGQGYKAYKGLRGTWAFPDFTLHVDHVQGDPFAAPSRVRAILPPDRASLEDAVLSTRSRRLGVASLLAKRFNEAARATMVRRGSGKSGLIEIETPGQEVLAQTAVIVGEDGTVEARFRIGLPAQGRRALGREAIALATTDVPAVVDQSLRAENVGHQNVLRHALTNEDADALRAELDAHNWVTFVADGAHLARRSGVDDRPLRGDTAIPFSTPAGLTDAVELPNAGTVSGMAIPCGVTLIVGGGYHGKSTVWRDADRRRRLPREEYPASCHRTRRVQPLPWRRPGARGDRSFGGKDPSRGRPPRGGSRHLGLHRHAAAGTRHSCLLNVERFGFYQPSGRHRGGARIRGHRPAHR